MSEISPAERAAMKSDPMPSGLNWRGIVEYIAYRALYRMYRHESITRDTASNWKRRLIAALDGAEGSYQFEQKLLDHAGERYRKMEKSVTEYRKNRTLESADRIVEAWDGMEEDHFCADRKRKEDGAL